MSGCEKPAWSTIGGETVEKLAVCGNMEGNKVCGALVLGDRILAGLCLTETPEGNQTPTDIPRDELL